MTPYRSCVLPSGPLGWTVSTLGGTLPVFCWYAFAQYFQLALAVYSGAVGPTEVRIPSYGLGFLPAWFSCWPKPSVSVLSVTSWTVGMPAFTFSMNCWEETWPPVTNRAVTCSLFHRSMKLASWDWAAV